MNVDDIVLVIIISVLTLSPFFVFTGCKIRDKIHDAKVRKVEVKYPDLIEAIRAYNDAYDSVVEYHNKKISPLHHQIDRLCADNYMLPEEKDAKLDALRRECAEYSAAYEECVEMNKKTRVVIQEIVDSCDDDINILWRKTKGENEYE